jgi:predicted DNA binding protein
MIANGPKDLDETEFTNLILENGSPDSFKISRTGPGTYLIMADNKSCGLCNIIAESGCFLESAVRINRDTLVWNLLSPDTESISNLVHKLKDGGCDVSEISIHEQNIQHGLTNRQRQVVLTAFELGYFDIPQRTNLDVLAERLGCAKSTLDIILRKAERKIVVQYFNGP